CALEKHAVIDTDGKALRRGHGEELARFVSRHAHRLLEEHIDPSLERSLGQPMMQVRRHQNVEHVYALLGQHGFERRVGRHAPAGGERLGYRRVGIADGHEFDGIRVLNAARVEIGDVAGPDDGGADRRAGHDTGCVQGWAPWLIGAAVWRAPDGLAVSRTSWKKSTYFAATT